MFIKKTIKMKLCIWNYLTAPSNWAQSLILLVARLYLARVFFLSGLTKITDWEKTIALFADEYKVPILSPELAALLATTAELAMPILLVLGLLTPFASFVLFFMAFVINSFVYPGLAENAYWMIIFALLFTHGAGKLSLDHWLRPMLNHWVKQWK